MWEPCGSARQVCVEDVDQGGFNWDGAVFVAFAAYVEDAAAVGEAEISER